jgi:hypothetical protein
MATRTWQGGNGGTWATTGNWSGGVVPTSSDDVIFSSDGTGASISAAAVCKSLTITGNNVTISGSSTLGIYGNITVNSTTVISATGVWSILNTAGQTTYDITSAGVTFNCSLTLNAGTASTYRLVKAASSANGDFTLSSLRTLTLTTGILNLNGYFLTVGLFSSNVSTTRSITFSSDHSNWITLTGVGTVFNIATSTGWSYTGYSDFTLTDATASGKTVTTTGMNIYPANFYFGGSGVVTLTSGNYFLNVDASVKTNAFSKSSTGALNIGGSVFLGPSMGSSGISGSGITTFSIVSGLGGSVTTGQIDLYGYEWGNMTFSSGNWQIYGNIGTTAATNDVVCSGGVLTVDYTCYFYRLTVSGGKIIINTNVTLNYTSTSAGSLTISSGIFEMTTSSLLYCFVMVVSGGVIRIDCQDNIDCYKVTFTGNAYWDGVLTYPGDLDYTDYGYSYVHIKHRTQISNWASTTYPQYRYQSTSTIIIVKFTTYDTASSTLRNISDASGFFAFCWDTGFTTVQRFGILTGSTIGGITLNNISPSTFEGGSNFTIKNGFMESGNAYRTQGGIITFTGNINAPYNYILASNYEAFPFSLIFGSNGYYTFSSTSLYAQRPDSYFYLNGCTIQLYQTDLSFGIINLNYGGTNKIISSSGARFYSTGTNGVVLNARGVTIQGPIGFNLYATTGTGRSVILPTFSDYFYSTSTNAAAEFYADYNGVSDLVTISDNSFLYSLTAYDSNKLSFTNLFLQGTLSANYATTINGTSLTLLGIPVSAYYYYNNRSYFNNLGSINNVYVGNSIVTNTNVSLSMSSDSINNLTLNSGNLTFVDAPYNNQRLPNITINSINTASSSTFAISPYISFGPTHYHYFIQNLTINNTRKNIFISDDTVLKTYPSSVSTWELGGITVPKIDVFQFSTINITDVNNSGTTYIKDITAVGTIGASTTIVYGTQSISVAGGTVTHSYNESTKTLTFSLYGGGGAVNGQTINLYYNINVSAATTVNYSYNWAVSSESGYDKGSINIGGSTVVSAVSGLSGGATNSGSGSGSVTFPSAGSWQLATMTYTKDGSGTAGSDTFSGSIAFTYSSSVDTNIKFQASRTFTFDKFFRNSSISPLTIGSDQSGVRTNLRIPVNNLGTLAQGSNPGGIYTATIQDCAVTSTNYMWFAGKNSVDAGNNSGWIFGKSPNSQTAVQFLL